MQRVRLILPYLHHQGVETEVMCVEPDQVAAPQDDWLAAGLPTEVPVHRVKAFDLKWGRMPGLGTLTFRALGALRRCGDILLRDGRFDLVYFSTTQFGVHVLGPYWKKKFGVPFVMDYQDPWVSDYYRNHPEVVPPGGRFKYAISSWMSRRQEPRVLRQCSGITSVSAAYPKQLAARYPWLHIVDMAERCNCEVGDREIKESRSETSHSRPDQSPIHKSPFTNHALPSFTMPFPGDPLDIERVRTDGTKQSVFDPHDGLKHWVYVGRGGTDMALAVKGLFAALKVESGKPAIGTTNLRIHFIGTSYAGAGRGTKTIQPLAEEYGLGEQVIEHTDRIPYSQTLRCLLDADALIIPGSDDPGYTASKIYPYLLAEKPLLAIFHEQSSVVELIRQVGGGTVVSFFTNETPEMIGSRIQAIPGFSERNLPHVPLDQLAFEPHTARAQASQLSNFFRYCADPQVKV